MSCRNLRVEIEHDECETESLGREGQESGWHYPLSARTVIMFQVALCRVWKGWERIMRNKDNGNEILCEVSTLQKERGGGE